MSNQVSREKLLILTVDIVSSYLSNNITSSDDIPRIIDQTFKALSDVSSDSALAGERPQPAVPINRSITPDYLICLEDGKKLKMLKRHLKTAYGMSPEEYRERWGLPADYPMVAPSYAERRSKLAKDIGLGTR